MIFNPSERKKVVSCNFPVFTANGEELSYASSFKYLGSVITNDLRDDADIEREIKCLFTRCNILLSRFQYCSKIVKLRLFIFSLTVCVFIIQLCGLYITKQHYLDL